MGCSLPGSSVHDIFQARVLKWGAIAFPEETPGVTGKFDLGVQNEAGQRLTVLPTECNDRSKHPLATTQEKTLHTDHHQMINSKIRLIMFFAAKEGDTLESQQKQDWELTVAQIMNSLLPNSDLN